MWEGQESKSTNSIEYVLRFREKLKSLGEFAKENLLKEQHNKKKNYNKGACIWEFQLGDQELFLLPTTESKLLAHFEIVKL